ncbi:unnamed protein product [Closterium sp. Naga37s-1]|nr:unnamed protein product [Closterium sp. Naga37s-1]
MASRREQEAAAAVLVQAESLLVQSRADNALALLVNLERTTPGAKGLAELLAVAQVLAAVGYTPECPRCRRPIGPLPKDYVDWFGVLQGLRCNSTLHLLGILAWSLLDLSVPQVDARTDEAGIKKRYRQLALLLHPDKNKSQKAEAAFRYVKEAHTILTDSNKRAVFDSLRSRLPPCPCSAPAGGRAMGVQRGAGGFRASQGASWAGNEAGRLQELREQAKARVVSLEREWEEKKEQWLRDFEQAKVQQQAQQQEQQEREEQEEREEREEQQQAQQQEQEEQQEQEQQAEREAEGEGEQEGEEETDVAKGMHGDEKSDGTVSDAAPAPPALQGHTYGEPSCDQTGIPEENPDLVGDSIWEQLADLVDDADVESEGKGRREGSNWSGSSGAQEDREAQTEVRKEGREKLEDKTAEKQAEKQAENQAEKQAEKRAEKRAEEQGSEAVEVTLSSPDVHGHGNSGRQVEREGDKEGVRAAVGSGATLSGAACTGDLHTSFRATTSGRAAADAMAAAAAATEAARKVLERSRSVLRKASVRAEECSVRPEGADEAGGAGEADGAGKKDTESEAGRVSASSVPGGAEGSGGKDDIGGSKEGRGGGKEGKEGKEGSGDVLVTLQRLRRDTQAVAASLDNLRRRLSARPAAVFPAADFPVDDFPAAAAGIVPVLTGSPPVQVPAS